MAVITDSYITDNIMKASFLALDQWIRTVIHHASNYELEQPDDLQINLKFKNYENLQTVVVRLACELHSCNIDELIEAFGDPVRYDSR